MAKRRDDPAMRLHQPFLKLPIQFCADTLAEEVRALPKSAWRPHPTRFIGNEAVRLVSPGGEPTDSIHGPMGPTEDLMRCPYTMEVMDELGGVWGRSRLMGLGPGADVPAHIDCHYYWVTHLRIHIPVITNPYVQFTCGDETVHMAPGECWVFDSFRTHQVHNGGSAQRVHLVLDTVGGERLWDLIEAAQNGSADGPPKLLSPGERRAPDLKFEQLNFPEVMAPSDMRWLFDFVAAHAEEQPLLEPVFKRMDRFLCAWAAAWARFGSDDEGLPTYRELIAAVQQDLDRLGGHDLVLRNGLKLYLAFNQLIFTNAIDSQRAEPKPGRKDAKTLSVAPAERPPAAAPQPPRPQRELIERPIFIVSPPRSGSTLLFETLAGAPDLYTIGTESHLVIENVPGLAPHERRWTSNRLSAEDASPETVELLARDFYERLMDREGHAPSGTVRMLEKTPKNSLRVPFFDHAWPGATFIYLYRDVRETLSSMMEAWASGRFRTYPRLPGWTGPYPWSLLLVPGWQQLNGLPLPEVVARQWATTTDILLDDLAKIPRQRLRAVAYSDLVVAPQPTIERLARSLDLEWDRQLGADLPLSKTTVSTPAREKWRRLEDVIRGVLPIVEAADARARAFVAEFTAE